MTAQDRAQFERDKAAGAVSVPVVAGATLAATAAPEIIPQAVQKAKAVAEWAKANPIKSVAIAKIADGLGIHPFDLMHSVVKYGKNLFGVSEPNSQWETYFVSPSSLSPLPNAYAARLKFSHVLRLRVFAYVSSEDQKPH